MPPCDFGRAALININFVPMALKRRLFHEVVNRFAIRYLWCHDEALQEAIALLKEKGNE